MVQLVPMHALSLAGTRRCDGVSARRALAAINASLMTKFLGRSEFRTLTVGLAIFTELYSRSSKCSGTNPLLGTSKRVDTSTKTTSTLQYKVNRLKNSSSSQMN